MTEAKQTQEQKRTFWQRHITSWEKTDISQAEYCQRNGSTSVDFVINGKTAIKVKGKANITKKDFKGLTAIKEEKLLKNYILVSLEDTTRKNGDICILPWKNFITNLWQDAYV